MCYINRTGDLGGISRVNNWRCQCNNKRGSSVRWLDMGIIAGSPYLRNETNAAHRSINEPVPYVADGSGSSSSNIQQQQPTTTKKEHKCHLTRIKQKYIRIVIEKVCGPPQWEFEMKNANVEFRLFPTSSTLIVSLHTYI